MVSFNKKCQKSKAIYSEYAKRVQTKAALVRLCFLKKEYIRVVQIP